MRLTRIEMEGIRGVSRVRIELAPGATVCVTGDAGAGKTAALEAIAAAREGFLPGALPPPPEAWCAPGRTGGFVELTWQLDALERAIVPGKDPTFVATWRPRGESTDVLARARDRIARTRIHYFDAHRLTAPASAFAAGGGPARPARDLDWTPSARKYEWLEAYLLARSENADRATGARLAERGVALATRDTSVFASALERLCPTVRAGRPLVRSGVRLAGFVRPDRTERTFAELTTGERMAVLFAATFDALELEGAIVLVDTPELGIHPSRHTAFLDGLARLVGTGTLIVATTSAAILRALPRDAVKVLEPSPS
ncbi:MAG: hypothetical protein U0414_05335 [Polyangiaceae bacterium]